MHDPYEVLGVERGADEAMVRRRYLELIREFTPERAPEQFAEIRAAYDQLRDPVVNLERRLFGLSTNHTFESIVDAARPDVRGQRLPSSFLLTLGR